MVPHDFTVDASMDFSMESVSDTHFDAMLASSDITSALYSHSPPRAHRGVFIIENLCNLQEVIANGGQFTACTYPMNYADITGLPCRVIAKI